MSMTDPIADLLTRIRNAQLASHDSIAMPHSRTREAIVRIKEAGPQSKLVGITVSEGVPRHGYSVLHEGTEVGKVASGTYSPTLEHGIATAYVPVSLASPGTEFQIAIRRKTVAAVVTRPPFVKTTSLNASAS